MKLSKAWNRKVHTNTTLQMKYRHLLEMKTPYQSSTIDGLHLLTKGPLEPDFLGLMKMAGHHKYLSKKSPYNESYSLGCVTLLLGPKFIRVAPFKLKINPSEGGLSLQQVVEWARFAIGDENNFRVKRVDLKIDLHNSDPVSCMRSFWANGFRTLDERYKDQSLYLGGKRSKRSIIVYDKATQSKLSVTTTHLWTRIEVREKYNKPDQIVLPSFIKSLRSSTPFKDLIVVNADNAELNDLLKKYKKSVIEDSVLKTFKQLSTYQRNAILKKLNADGNLTLLSHQYSEQLKLWLKY